MEATTQKKKLEFQHIKQTFFSTQFYIIHLYLYLTFIFNYPQYSNRPLQVLGILNSHPAMLHFLVYKKVYTEQYTMHTTIVLPPSDRDR